MYTKIHCLHKHASQCATKEHCLTTAFGLFRGLLLYLLEREIPTAMIERGLYYPKSEFGEMIRSLGGTWNDTKHRPIVCLIESSECPGLYWAIPMGKLNHRDQEQQARLEWYMNLPSQDIRSCYYHVGRTTTRSIFFISDAIPITEKYIDAIHTGGDNKHYIIKNANLAAELERKLFRILSVENSRNNHFRQHITDVKNHLITELNTATK